MDADLRGVNLGGWLVLEKWITPGLFKGTRATDEYTLCDELGSAEATKRLALHRDTFITEAHIKQIADLGLSLLRLPLGYWLFDHHEPYISGTDRYVDLLLTWAERHGLKVILDFHAAPGSQNGWDHSGRSGSVGWPNPHNITASLTFIEKLADRYGDHPSVIGIEPLNEPHWEVPLDLLVDYYHRAYEIIRERSHAGVAVIVSDAFRAEAMSKALRKAHLNIVLDVHLYQLFTPEDRALDLPGHIKKAQKDWARLLKKLTKHHDVLIGEWSAAMSELYDDVGERQHLYDEVAYETYAHAQQQVFQRQRVSWTYWTARTEDGGVWSLLDHSKILR